MTNSIFKVFILVIMAFLFLFSCNNHEDKNKYFSDIIYETKKICKCKDSVLFNRIVTHYLSKVNDSNMTLYEIANPFEIDNEYFPYFEYYLKERKVRIRKLLTRDYFRENEMRPFFDSLCILKNISTLLVKQKYGSTIIDSLRRIASRDHRKDIIINRRYYNDNFDLHDSDIYFKLDTLSKNSGVIVLNGNDFNLDRIVKTIDIEIQVDEEGMLKNSHVKRLYSFKDEIITNYRLDIIRRFEKTFEKYHKYSFTPCYFSSIRYSCKRDFKIVLDYSVIKTE